MERFDERHVTFVEKAGAAVRVRLFCLDPSRLLAESLKRGIASVFFSATLSPTDYFRDALGGSAEDGMLRLESPFPRERMQLMVDTSVRTDFRARSHTYEEVARLIGEFAEARTGRYMAFFPSYDYLRETLSRFRRAFPAVDVVEQSRAMNDLERAEFLDEFELDDLRDGDRLRDAAGSERCKVGFAVMGGLFGEGIDLVGERLIGAIVVGVGLPQVCIERNLIRAHFDQRNGAGFAYAYIYPGMTKVLQAIGRVIRSETDRGMALLIDARFGQRPYSDLLPGWWAQQKCTRNTVRHAATNFWSGA